MSLTRASSELSVIIDPSLLLKKTPPIIFLWDYYKLNWLRSSFESIYFPVYLSIMSLKDF
jgi:hypothetical protein